MAKQINIHNVPRRVNRYVGTEAERLALTMTADFAGSTFYETDTGTLWILDTAANWERKLSDVNIYNKHGDFVNVASNEDISGGVAAELPNFSKWTLYLDAAAAIDITISLSPDNDMFYPLEEVIEFAAAGYEVIEFGFTAMTILIEGSNAELVTAQIRGVF